MCVCVCVCFSSYSLVYSEPNDRCCVCVFQLLLSGVLRALWMNSAAGKKYLLMSNQLTSHCSHTTVSDVHVSVIFLSCIDLSLKIFLTCRSVQDVCNTIFSSLTRSIAVFLHKITSALIRVHLKTAHSCCKMYRW